VAVISAGKSEHEELFCSCDDKKANATFLTHVVGGVSLLSGVVAWTFILNEANQEQMLWTPFLWMLLLLGNGQRPGVSTERPPVMGASLRDPFPGKQL
jgi:hypothetical protein